MQVPDPNLPSKSDLDTEPKKNHSGSTTLLNGEEPQITNETLRHQQGVCGWIKTSWKLPSEGH
jgi:hypothetical protein